MAPLILLAFVAIPLIEIALFIELGGWLGTGWTVGLVLLTAVIGTALWRHQGLSTWRAAEAEVREGRTPLRQVYDGACLLVAGAFLITPGFFTDTLGFLLMIPALRAGLLVVIQKTIIDHADVVIVRSHDPSEGPGPGPGRQGAARPYDIDGEYTEVDPEPPERLDRS